MAPPRDLFPKFPKWLVIGALVVFANGTSVFAAVEAY